MEQKIKPSSLIKISAFIFLTWISHINDDIITYNKLSNESYSISKKIGLLSYRLLAKYKQHKNSYYTELRDDIPNNRDCKIKDISNYEKGAKKKNRQSIQSSLNKAQYYTEVMDYNNGMFDGKHFHFEKKLIKKKHYDDFLEKNRRICNMALKKIKFRSYGFGVTTFFLFFVLGIGIPILKGLESVKDLLKVKPIDQVCNLIKKIPGLTNLEDKYIYLIFFGVLIIILTIILLIAIPKILSNNEKYKKIKLISQLNE
ncbi:fam-m protein [Plasmodium brasilianum]|uniref:Fam-m protein n=1 Tax=Plasmodium brasilianum TaxID=5824 RepID=A0ACB9YBX0_PLABR|nr:fam-m protein [Plasmodium brasilianum]